MSAPSAPSPPKSPAAENCPVCGAEIEARATAIAQHHEGQLLFFRSARCVKVFRMQPERYVDGPCDTCPLDAAGDTPAS